MLFLPFVLCWECCKALQLSLTPATTRYWLIEEQKILPTGMHNAEVSLNNYSQLMFSNFKIVISRKRLLKLKQHLIIFLLSGLGDNWALAIVETEREGYVMANYVEISDNVHSYLIGGSTRRRLDRQMWWRYYRLDNKGISKSES